MLELKKMIYAMSSKEINIKLRDIFEMISTDEPSDLYKENILKKLNYLISKIILN